MRSNKVFLEEMTKKSSMSLFDCVDTELAMDIAKLNGRTNSKNITKDERSTYKAKYESTARTLVRMMWLCDFCCGFIDKLINSDTELVPICQESYTRVFGNYHPWIVRTMAQQAFKFVGTKEHARVSWGYDNFDEMKPLLLAMSTLKQTLHAELSKRNCLELA